MTLEEAAFTIVKNACVNAAVYKFYSSPLDAIKRDYRYLPPEFVEHPMVERAREMLQDWDRFASPEDLAEIVEKVKAMREHLMKADPATYSQVLRLETGP